MMKDKSNVAVFSFAFNPFEGGAEIAAREIIQRISNYNFTVFTHKFDRHWLSGEHSGNLEVIRLGKGKKIVKSAVGTGHYYGRIWDKIFYVIRAWQKAEKLYAQKRFRIIWAVMASYGGLAAFLFKLNHPSVPLFLTVQEGDSGRHLVLGKFGLVGLFGKQIIRKADYIQVISNYLKDFVLKRGASSQVEVVPNGVDLELFSAEYDHSELKAVRSNLGIFDEYVIITTSRLVNKNAMDILIKAIAEIKNNFLNIKCLIIGDGPERKNLELLAKKLGVESNILFLGQMAQRDLPLYFKVSDVFVRPSRSEGLGSSFLESMAAGVPVIGTPVGGIVDFLKDEETGFFAESEDHKNLAAKIKYVLGNSALRKKVVENSLALVNQNYSWDNIAKLFRDIFDKLADLH